MRKNKAGFTPPFLRGGIRIVERAGFTLIEMLIVTAMLSIVSLVVYATLNNGIKIWQRINQEIPVEDMDIFFEKFASDLRNSLKITGITFSGEEDGFEFATLVNSQRLEKTTVGKVKYKYDYSKSEIMREQMDYSNIYNSESGIGRTAARNIKSMKFNYYIYDDEKQEYIWRDEYTGQQGLPAAVRIELELKNNDQTNKFTKTVSIPLH